MIPEKILVLRKMSALEFYYKGKHKSKVINESAESHNEKIKQIKNILKKSGKKFDIVTREELSEEFVKKYDAVISAGGDGTVIAAAAYNSNVPQLNLKTDSKSVGALCQEDIFNSVNSLLKGNYTIQEWQRQDIYLDGKFVGRASNETCIGEQLRFDKLAKYKLSFLDEKEKLFEENQSGSGIIISTGTGSGAWPAAFTQYEKESKYFSFKTILKHSGQIEEGKANYLKLVYLGHEGKFSIDTKEYALPRDSTLEIKLSKNPLRVIIPTK